MYKIDPIYGKENLVWAPNKIVGQHSKEALENVVNKLKQTDELFGTRKYMVDALKELGQIAAKRR